MYEVWTVMLQFSWYVTIFISILIVNFWILYFRRNSRIQELTGAPTNPGVKHDMWVDNTNIIMYFVKYLFLIYVLILRYNYMYAYYMFDWAMRCDCQ